MPAIYFKGKRYGTGVKGAQGEQGVQGVSITDVELVQPNNQLMVTLSTGEVIPAGNIQISGGEVVLENYYTKTETDDLISEELSDSVLSEQEIRDIFI